MTTEIQEKAKWLSDIYAAVAKGETLQGWSLDESQWVDTSLSTSLSGGPNMGSMERRWRIKPKPLRIWAWLNQSGEIVDATRHEERANAWKSAGHNVVETVEVLP